MTILPILLFLMGCKSVSMSMNCSGDLTRDFVFLSLHLSLLSLYVLTQECRGG